jgi:spermidine synthase
MRGFPRPWHGMEHYTKLCTAVMTTACVALGCPKKRRSSLTPIFHVPLGATAVCTLAVTVTLPFARLDFYHMASGVYRAAQVLLTPNDTLLLFHKDGKTATVDLIDRNGFVGIRTNGKVDAQVNMQPDRDPTPDESTMVLIGALPLLLHLQARTAANIGLGSGITTHMLLRTPSLASVDPIEIEAAMVEDARGFRPRNERAYDDPRSRVHLEDAKTFFSTHHTQYDLIVSEPSNPWVSGVAGLFS